MQPCSDKVKLPSFTLSQTVTRQCRSSHMKTDGEESLPESGNCQKTLVLYSLPRPAVRKDTAMRLYRFENTEADTDHGSNGNSQLGVDTSTATPPPDDYRHHLGTFLHQPAEQHLWNP